MGNVFRTLEGDLLWLLSTLGSDSTIKNSFSSFLSYTHTDACTHARTKRQQQGQFSLTGDFPLHCSWNWRTWTLVKNSTLTRTSSWSPPHRVLMAPPRCLPFVLTLRLYLVSPHLPRSRTEICSTCAFSPPPLFPLCLYVVPTICYYVHRCCEVCYASCRWWATEHW